MDRQVIDRETFDQLRDSMGDGFIDELIDTYLDDSPQLIDTMRRSLQTGDAEAFRRAAHSLKSNSASFGAQTLSGMARELEMLGKSGTLDGASPLLEALSAEYDLVQSQLMEWRNEPSPKF